VAGEEAADRAVAEDQALICERATQLFDRNVWGFFNEGEDRRAMSLNPT
jgi:hypothetical protein